MQERERPLERELALQEVPCAAVTQREQQAAAQEKAKQAYNADVGGYKRAFGACMTGRGYTVS